MTATISKIKISPNTLNVLKNFSTINSNLHVKPGNHVATVSPSMTVLAEAELPETFPVEFGIWDMSKFLSVISLFREPEFEFDQNFVLVSESGSKASVKYYYSDPQLLTKADKKITMPKSAVSFDLSREDLGSILKAASVIQAPDMCVEVCSEGLCVRVCDRKDPTAHSWTLNIDEDGKTDRPDTFRSWFKVENLKMLPSVYRVDIAEKRVAKFTGAVSYWVAMEAEK